MWWVSKLALVPFTLVRRTTAPPSSTAAACVAAGAVAALVVAWLLRARAGRREPWRRLSVTEMHALIAEARSERAEVEPKA